jgi:hypothetical protein
MDIPTVSTNYKPLRRCVLIASVTAAWEVRRGESPVRELEDIFPGKARYDMAREINGVFLKGETPPYAACFTYIGPPRDMPFSAPVRTGRGTPRLKPI